MMPERRIGSPVTIPCSQSRIVSGIGGTCETRRQIDPKKKEKEKERKKRYSSRETRPWQRSRFQETRRYVHLLFMTKGVGRGGSSHPDPS